MESRGSQRGADVGARPLSTQAEALVKDKMRGNFVKKYVTKFHNNLSNTACGKMYRKLWHPMAPDELSDDKIWYNCDTRCYIYSTACHSCIIFCHPIIHREPSGVKVSDTFCHMLYLTNYCEILSRTFWQNFRAFCLSPMPQLAYSRVARPRQHHVDYL